MWRTYMATQEITEENYKKMERLLDDIEQDTTRKTKTLVSEIEKLKDSIVAVSLKKLEATSNADTYKKELTAAMGVGEHKKLEAEEIAQSLTELEGMLSKIDNKTKEEEITLRKVVGHNLRYKDCVKLKTERLAKLRNEVEELENAISVIRTEELIATTKLEILQKKLMPVVEVSGKEVEAGSLTNSLKELLLKRVAEKENNVKEQESELERATADNDRYNQELKEKNELEKQLENRLGVPRKSLASLLHLESTSSSLYSV